MIEHKVNGYVAEYKSAEDFAEGIFWYLINSEKDKIEIEARNKVLLHYNEKLISEKYIDLYNNLTKQK